MPRRFLLVFVYFFIVLFTVLISQLVRERSLVSVLTFHACTSDSFRKQQLSPELYTSLISATKVENDWTDQLTALMLDTDFRPGSSLITSKNKMLYVKFKPIEYHFLQNCYRAIWKDLAFFPVDSDRVIFENDWLKETGCDENTQHQGTDIIGFSPYPGYFPVVSVSDGTVIQTGWEAQSRYKILIQGPSGGFFYYSMLSSFERNWNSGDFISAGDILGYTGTPESSPLHSFTQNFSCLHFGIYINDRQQQKISVNPYWVLRAIHKKIRNYTY